VRTLEVNETVAVGAGQAACKYAGQEYSHGAILKIGDYYIQCQDGEWRSIPVPIK
jgi:hypothetical protein